MEVKETLLEYESTILAPDFKERASKLLQFKTINAYVLSKEDKTKIQKKLKNIQG